jgi:cell filamentation protein
VSKGLVLFAHPNDAQAAVDYGLSLGSEAESMRARAGEVMGYLAFGHPFLDGNGRTIMVVHAELADRAGFSIGWTATRKEAYLDALTKEIERPGIGYLDDYLRRFQSSAVGIDRLVEHIVATRGLDGSIVEENRVLGRVTDPELQARYKEQRMQREVRERGQE